MLSQDKACIAHCIFSLIFPEALSDFGFFSIKFPGFSRSGKCFLPFSKFSPDGGNPVLRMLSSFNSVFAWIYQKLVKLFAKFSTLVKIRFRGVWVSFRGSLGSPFREKCAKMREKGCPASQFRGYFKTFLSVVIPDDPCCP